MFILGRKKNVTGPATSSWPKDAGIDSCANVSVLIERTISNEPILLSWCNDRTYCDCHNPASLLKKAAWVNVTQ